MTLIGWLYLKTLQKDVNSPKPQKNDIVVRHFIGTPHQPGGNTLTKYNRMASKKMGAVSHQQFLTFTAARTILLPSCAGGRLLRRQLAYHEDGNPAHFAVVVRCDTNISGLSVPVRPVGLYLERYPGPGRDFGAVSDPFGCSGRQSQEPEAITKSLIP